MAEYLEKALVHAALINEAARTYPSSFCLGIEAAADFVMKLPGEDVVPRSEFEACRNELCLQCGRYKMRHLGFCNDCRWRGER